MANFPLPEGYSRTVYRPNRTPDRRADLGAVVRFVKAALRQGVAAEAICHAVSEVEGMEECGPDCEKAKKIVADFLEWHNDQDIVYAVDLIRELMADIEAIIGAL